MAGRVRSSLAISAGAGTVGSTGVSTSPASGASTSATLSSTTGTSTLGASAWTESGKIGAPSPNRRGTASTCSVRWTTGSPGRDGSTGRGVTTSEVGDSARRGTGTVSTSTGSGVDTIGSWSGSEVPANLDSAAGSGVGTGALGVSDRIAWTVLTGGRTDEPAVVNGIDGRSASRDATATAGSTSVAVGSSATIGSKAGPGSSGDGSS
ncbi:hypothetical protein DMC61_40535 [Amycolatopsis sp. WAC 04169]|uniref:hypothetical protein n=1 Tax=Amycolatopsis sp. WAC 04169 TaxID=2203197 RepID=UPI000F76A890|nr:hypothetical protein [Amycolatopsis sp. WAC 04169]RSN19213.1 hypothetical protein DMC61_40535 [Amycolatopsis sp. WAC 04169]